MRLLVENGADPKMNTLLNITPLMLTAGIAWVAYQDTASEEQVLDESARNVGHYHEGHWLSVDPHLCVLPLADGRECCLIQGFL